jgi:hypothetical protein
VFDLHGVVHGEGPAYATRRDAMWSLGLHQLFEAMDAAAPYVSEVCRVHSSLRQICVTLPLTTDWSTYHRVAGVGTL